MKNNLQEYLFSLKDEEYRLFHSKIIGADVKLIGIRTPIIIDVAKEVFKKLDTKEKIIDFVLSDSEFYEELLIKGIVISFIKNDDELIIYLLKNYVLKINNWAVCDIVSNKLKVIKSKQEVYIPFIQECLKSPLEYVVRFGLVILLDFYIDENYIDYVLTCVCSSYPDYYYINMALAWLICECFIKYPDKTIKIFDYDLNKFVINKAISKINDSFRVDKETKKYLKTFKK